MINLSVQRFRIKRLKICLKAYDIQVAYITLPLYRYSSLIYYATIIGIDTSLFEAAEIDGANKFQLIKNITIPSLIPIVCLMLIMSMGNAMTGNFDLFYQIPRQSAALYATTDIIDTYVYRMLTSGSITTSSAVSLFQSVVGTIMLLVTNTIVRKVSPENSMF